MSNKHDNSDERSGMSPVTAMLLGLGVGIVGTVIVVAANEERFGSAVRRTRVRAREVGENVRVKYEDVKNNTRERGASAAYAVEHGAKKIGDKLSE